MSRYFYSILQGQQSIDLVTNPFSAAIHFYRVRSLHETFILPIFFVFYFCVYVFSCFGYIPQGLIGIVLKDEDNIGHSC